MDNVADTMKNEPQAQTITEEAIPKEHETDGQQDAHLVIQELIDNTPDLTACPLEEAIMICGATGTWSKMAKVQLKLANDPLKAFEMLNNTQYTAMREYYNHRRITDGIEEANAFWE
ncbi:MAG: hypothetical protein IJU65_11115 [Desulfovibrio sp.]|nr:hypothetical protein [Desulfovibrio sp.]